MLDVGYWLGCWMLDIGFKMLDVGYWVKYSNWP